MRDDDGPLLEECRRVTGLGMCWYGGARGTSNPRVCWKIHKKAEVKALAALLEEYPLRSKKARDFEVWKRAVDAWVAMKRAYRTGPRKTAGGRLLGTATAMDWSELEALAHELRGGRTYAPPSA